MMTGDSPMTLETWSVSSVLEKSPRGWKIFGIRSGNSSRKTYIWVNYNDLSTTSLGMMVSRVDYLQRAHFRLVKYCTLRRYIYSMFHSICALVHVKVSTNDRVTTPISDMPGLWIHTDLPVSHEPMGAMFLHPMGLPKLVPISCAQTKGMVFWMVTLALGLFTLWSTFT